MFFKIVHTMVHVYLCDNESDKIVIMTVNICVYITNAPVFNISS